MSDEQHNQEVPNEQPVIDPVEQLTKERDDFKISWQRALADYQNLLKETAARRSEMAMMSEQQIVEEFIPVYDNFKKAFAIPPGTEDNQVKNWVMGIGYIMKQFGEVLKAHNVMEIKTVGEVFNPIFHETVGEEESEKPSGTVLKEAEGGYLMGNRVIKPAKVVVAK